MCVRVVVKYNPKITLCHLPIVKNHEHAFGASFTKYFLKRKSHKKQKLFRHMKWKKKK